VERYAYIYFPVNFNYAAHHNTFELKGYWDWTRTFKLQRW